MIFGYALFATTMKDSNLLWQNQYVLLYNDIFNSNKICMRYTCNMKVY